MTQTQFAAIAGVSKGHMSEVEAGIAPLGDKLKVFLEEISIDAETVAEKHKIYMGFKRRQHRAAAERIVQAEELSP